MSMITTTHPVAGFESRPSWVVAVRKDHWGFWSSLGWVVLALTVATVSIVPLSFAYFTLNGLTGAFATLGRVQISNSAITGQ